MPRVATSISREDKYHILDEMELMLGEVMIHLYNKITPPVYAKATPGFAHPPLILRGGEAVIKQLLWES